MDRDIDQVIDEYGAESLYAQSIDQLYDLDEEKLWALLVDASEAGRYDEGLAISVRLLDFDEANDMVYHEMGYFLMKKSLYNSAILFYRKVLQLNPDNHASQYNLGEIYLKQANISQAQTLFKRAQGLDPTNDQYTIQLAKTYIIQRKYDQALSLYLPLVKEIEEGKIDITALSDAEYMMYADIYYDLALIYFYGKKDSAKALLLLQKYDEWNPNDEDALSLSAEISRKK